MSLFLVITFSTWSGVGHTAILNVPNERVLAEKQNARARMLKYEALIQANPDNLQARYELARALLELGEYARAEKMADTVFRRTGLAEARLIVAETKLYQGRLLEAFDTLAESSDLSVPEQSFFSIIKGEKALAEGNFSLAIRTVQPILSDQQYAYNAKVILARAYYAAGDLGAAQRIVSEIAASGSQNITVQIFRAQLSLRAGDTGTAIRIAQAVLSIDAGNIPAGSVLIEAHMKDGAFEKAESMLNDLVKRSSGDPRVDYLEGLLLRAKGDVRGASRAVNSIEDWLAVSPGGALFLADIKRELGFTAQAESILRQRLSVAPTDISVISALVTMLDKAGRTKEADSILERSRQLMPGHPGLVRFQADRLMAMGDFDRSLQLLETLPSSNNAIEFLSGADNDSAASIMTQMFAAIRSGNRDQAIELAKSAPQNSVLVQNMLAAAYAEKGDRAKAVLILDRIIAQEPDFLAVIINRASLNPSPEAMTQSLQQAVNAGATSAQIYRQMAIETFVLGDIQRSVSFARKTVTARDSQLADLLLAGRILLAAGKMEEAVSAFETIRVPGSAEPSFAIDHAWYLSHAGATEKAVRLIRDIPRQSLSLGEYIRLSQILARHSEYSAEANLLSEARKQFPNNLSLTEAYLKSMARVDLSRAQKELSRINELNEATQVALSAELLFAAGRPDEAREALALAPDSGQVFASLASNLTTIDHKRALLNRITDYLNAQPDDRAVLLIMSGVALEVGDIARAEKALTQALAEMPGNPSVLNNLAISRQHRVPEEALKLAQQAYEISPDDVLIAETYAKILTITNNSEKAGRVARRGLLADPSATVLNPYRGL